MSNAKVLTPSQIWQLLDEVKDPEIPVVSVVEMGIIREVVVERRAGGETVRVTMTPTFAGCPALQQMQVDIEQRLRDAGAQQVAVKVSLSPAWSTDQITPQGRDKLKAFGLAPPRPHGGNFELALLDVVVCPYCGSQDTLLKNSFGPTLCRAIYYCNACQQPFEQFKPL